MFCPFHTHFVHYDLLHNGVSHLKQRKYPAVLPHLTDTASNLAAYSNLLIADCYVAYCVEILLRLGVAVCRL